eukprot:TRINITY_DN136511_c0_g1_i1.p1 TRINITY_DN136511_c0_g1~~TRINITY_DN136511_c0_g1_i1.p1  ORF type:complete len:241 (+),score=33.86 TRINITY_DN136511_c0_g1_i1:13-735(+)
MKSFVLLFALIFCLSISSSIAQSCDCSFFEDPCDFAEENGRKYVLNPVGANIKFIDGEDSLLFNFINCENLGVSLLGFNYKTQNLFQPSFEDVNEANQSARSSSLYLETQNDDDVCISEGYSFINLEELIIWEDSECGDSESFYSQNPNILAQVSDLFFFRVASYEKQAIIADTHFTDTQIDLALSGSLPRGGDDATCETSGAAETPSEECESPPPPSPSNSEKLIPGLLLAVVFFFLFF